MDIQEFTVAIRAQFLDADTLNLQADTDFRDNDEFDSLTGMAILVMIKDRFNYQMSVADFLSCKTATDLYSLIQTKTK